MSRFHSLTDPVETDLLVAFSDLTNFARFATGVSSMDLFRTVSDYFEFAGEIVEGAGGTVVKCIGDALLAVFPAEAANAGVLALKRLKDEGDRWLEGRGLPCRHRIKAHFGPVVCGPIGTKDRKRFDVYGQTVNTAALLRSMGLAISPPAFRTLEPETRKLFKKHTPPIVYIPVEESHPAF